MGVLTVNGGVKKRTVKEIKVNVDKCTGCRACELSCAAFHASPRYSSINPARARIRVLIYERTDLYVPVRATNYTPAECSGRQSYIIDKKEYSQCSFCGASCPSREHFKEPDSGLPLKCDMCEDEPPLSEPMCVQACTFGALTYEETLEEQGKEKEAKPEDLKIGLESLVNKYGPQKVTDAVTRMSLSRKG
ncbi:MAG: (4Fe-4S)-binding protein [Syntrophobacterales bacterium]|nr:(4Fe-4S)-binding protein [Syntrophobacterales bacterium]